MFSKRTTLYIRVITGFVGLFIGALIYLSDRSPESTYFVWQFFRALGQTFYGNYPDLFGCMDKNLASFLHTFSFTMITGAFIAESGTGCLISALMWCTINVLFEVGQYFDTIVIKFVPSWFEKYLFLKTVDDYFIAGVFDFWDIAAVLTGAVTGYLVLIYTIHKENK